MRTLFLLTVMFLAPLAQASEGQTQTEYSLWTSREALDRGKEDWTEYGMRLEHRSRASQNASVFALQARRFGQRDNQWGLGFSMPATERLTASIDTAFSDTYRVLPRSSIQGQLHMKFEGGVGGWAGLRRTRYSEALVDLATLGVERYMGDYRFAYTLYVASQESASRVSSHRVQAARYAENWSLGASYARGREVESVGLGRVTVSDVRTLGLQAARRLQPDVWLNLDIGKQRQGNFHERRGARISLRLGF